jgi:poly-gamma-glutamate capsule biosynthesis protein CapA/YwtB (metallophosphatase superfamily)
MLEFWSVLLLIILMIILLTFNTSHAAPSSLPRQLRAENIDPAAVPPKLSRSSSASFKNTAVELIFVGDVMLGRQVNLMSLAHGDPRWPFLETAPVLQQADLTIGNLEAPLVPHCSISSRGMQLCAPAESAVGLRWAGFDMMGIANNHALDYGNMGLAETVSILSGEDIQVIRDDHTASVTIRGLRIGILAFEDTFMHPLNVDHALEIVSGNARHVDVQIVLMHWGEEYHAQPTAQQMALGHKLIDAGGDLVIGAHPHWTQPVEEYGSGVIFYSLGNFVFDQMWSDETRQGQIALITLTRQPAEVSMSYQLLPIKIFDFGQPRFLPSISENQKHPN